MRKCIVPITLEQLSEAFGLKVLAVSKAKCSFEMEDPQYALLLKIEGGPLAHKDHDYLPWVNLDQLRKAPAEPQIQTDACALESARNPEGSGWPPGVQS